MMRTTMSDVLYKQRRVLKRYELSSLATGLRILLRTTVRWVLRDATCLFVGHLRLPARDKYDLRRETLMSPSKFQTAQSSRRGGRILIGRRRVISEDIHLGGSLGLRIRPDVSPLSHWWDEI